MAVMFWIICGLISGWLYLKLAKEEQGYLDGIDVGFAVLFVLFGCVGSLFTVGIYICTRRVVVETVRSLVDWIDSKV